MDILKTRVRIFSENRKDIGTFYGTDALLELGIQMNQSEGAFICKPGVKLSIDQENYTVIEVRFLILKYGSDFPLEEELKSAEDPTPFNSQLVLVVRRE